MATHTTIQIKHRYPTAKLASAAAQFLPACDWKPARSGDWYFLQFRCESAKAHRILNYLRRDYPGMKFEALDAPPAVNP